MKTYFPKQNKEALITHSVYLHFLLKNNTRMYKYCFREGRMGVRHADWIGYRTPKLHRASGE
jgi:hypothetical protein